LGFELETWGEVLSCACRRWDRDDGEEEESPAACESSTLMDIGA